MSPSESGLGSRITLSATAERNGPGRTLVPVHVKLPQGITQAHVASSANRYPVSSQADGKGGMVVTLFLDVPIA